MSDTPNKYVALCEALAGVTANQITWTFDHVESLLGFSLPDAEEKTWWGCADLAPHCLWQTKIDYLRRHIQFTRITQTALAS